MPRPRAFSRSHPKFCSTVFLEGALSRGPLFRGPRGPTQAPSPAPPAPLLSVALGPGAPENTELGMELESASWLSPLSLRVPVGEGPGHSGQQTEASFLHGQCVCVWGGCIRPCQEKAPSRFQTYPRTAHERLSGPPWWRSLAAEGSSLYAAPLKTELCSSSTLCVRPSPGR